MNIVMMTNTYKPFVGGVPKSVEQFTEEYRNKGHEVLVVAPCFENQPSVEEDVVRVPSIQNFNGTDFSVRVPVPGIVTSAMEDFEPDLIHAHHPFLMGVTALRIANQYQKPLVFTHHTLYEQYTHYLPIDNQTVKDYAREIATRYANLCDRVFAPSESVRALIRDRGVETPVEVVPTGVEIDRFSRGHGARFRRRHGVPEDADVVGHLGRLAPEKNLTFLAESVVKFMTDHDDTHFLLIGDGPSRDELEVLFERHEMSDRLHMAGTLEGQELIDGYHAMNVFVFASKTETQGMVLVEAMASGLPVVALDASGSRDVVEDRGNGRLVSEEDPGRFARAIEWIYREADPENLRVGVADTAHKFSMDRCAGRALNHYEQVIEEHDREVERDENLWSQALRQIETEWEILKNMEGAAESVLEYED